MPVELIQGSLLDGSTVIHEKDDYGVGAYLLTIHPDIITFGSASQDTDVKIFLGASDQYVLFDVGNALVTFAKTDVAIAGDLTVTLEDISVDQGKYIYLDGQDGAEYVRSDTAGDLMLNATTNIHLAIGGTDEVDINATTMAMNANTITGVGDIEANDAAGPTVVNEAATTTNPTLCPNRAEDDTGIGWASDTLHIVLGGADEYSFSTTTLDMNSNTITDSGSFNVTDAAGPIILNEATTVTNPTLIPNRADETTGIGWNTAEIHLVISGADEYDFSATALDMNGNNLEEVGTFGMTGGLTISPTAAGTFLDFELEDEWVSGTLIRADFAAGPTTFSGDVIGMLMDFDSNVTAATDQDLTAYQVLLPDLDQAVANTTIFIGWNLSTAGAIVQSAGAGTLSWRGINLQLPDITQAFGTVTAYGINIAAGTVTSGSEIGVVMSGTMTAGIDLSGATLTNDILLQNSATITNGGADTLTITEPTIALVATTAITLASNASNLVLAGDTDSALQFTDESMTFIDLDTRDTVTGVANVTITGIPATVAQSAGMTKVLLALAPGSTTISNATGVTAMEGLALNIAQPTITSATNPAVAIASTVYIADAPLAGGTATITAGYALHVAAGASLFAGDISLVTNAVDIIMIADTDSALEFFDGTTKFIDIDTRVTVTAVANMTLTGMPATIVAASGLTHQLLALVPGTTTLTGSTGITAMNGLGLSLAQPTITDEDAVTVVTASTVYIANAPTGAGSGPATLTNAYSLYIDAGDVRFDGTTGSNYFHWDDSADDLLLVGTATQFSVAGTTNSSSVSTGAINTAGGLGVAQDFFLGGDMSIATGKKITTVAELTLNSVDPLTIQIGGVDQLQLDETAISTFAGATDTAGHAAYLETEDGGADGGAGTGRAGGLLNIKTGDGSVSGTATAVGGAGGNMTLESGVGNTGNTTGNGGAGGDIAITAGAAGDSGAGVGEGGVGGDIVLTAGAGGGAGGGSAGMPGRVSIGAGLFTMKVQTIAMGDNALTLTMNPDAPAGTLMIGNILFVDAESSGTENLLLPYEADCEGMALWVINTGGETINLQDDAGGGLLTIGTTENGFITCDGTTWIGSTGVL